MIMTMTNWTCPDVEISMSDRIEKLSLELQRKESYQVAKCCANCTHVYERNHYTDINYYCRLLDKEMSTEPEMICSLWEGEHD